jgi:hypothetical protein
LEETYVGFEVLKGICLRKQSKGNMEEDRTEREIIKYGA